MIDLRSALIRNMLFAGLSAQQLEQIARASRLKSFVEGQALAREWEHGDRFFVLVEGSVRVSRVNEEGDEVIYRVLHPPAGIGYLLLSNQPHTADVVAAAEAVVVSVPVAELRALFVEDPSLSFRAIADLAAIVDTLSTELLERQTVPLGERVRIAVLRHADSAGVLRVSHEELGRLVGATRANITRALRSLEENGELVVRRRFIQLVKR